MLIDDVLCCLTEQHAVRLLVPELPEESRAFWVGGAPSDEDRPYEVRRFSDKVSLINVRGHRLTRGLIPPMSLSGTWALWRHAKDFDADAIMCFLFVPFGLPSLLVKMARRLRLVLVLCGTDLPSPRTSTVPAWASYVRESVKRADRTVFVSRFSMDSVLRRPPRHDRDLVIYGGVDGSRMSPHRGAAQLRSELGLTDKDVLVLSLGRIAQEKRVDVVLRAFAAISRRNSRVSLVIAGQGPGLDDLRTLATDLGVSEKVSLVGHLGREKADYFAACDVFAFHSLYETFGQVVAEALWCGKPVVASAVGAVPEVVEDGVTGLLVAPLDVTGFASALSRLVEDPHLRETLGRAGRAAAVSRFCWEHQREQWLRVLNPEFTRGSDVAHVTASWPEGHGSESAEGEPSTLQIPRAARP